MTRERAIAAILPVLAGCQAALTSVRPALDQEGEVYVYLQPLPSEATRLEVSVGLVEARRADGVAFPLAVPPADRDRPDPRGQRLLAWGRLPPGSYSGLSVRFRSATLDHADGRMQLLIPPEALPVEIPFAVERRRSQALWLSLDRGRSFQSAATFAPSLSAAQPPPLVPGLAAYATSPEAGTLTVLDRHSRQVAAVAYLGGEPRGIALAEVALRAYVALAAEDAVAVVDLASQAVLARIRLRAGDRPREVALTPDGQTLLVLNQGSSTLAFVDVAAEVERDRVPVGRDPVYLLLDRAGRNAYVCNRMASSVSVVSVATRSLAATVATEGGPSGVALNRSQDRLYVLQPLSPWLSVLSARDLSLLQRVAIGLGAETARVDARTDLLWVGRSGDGALDAYEPSLLVSVAALTLPAGAAHETVDDSENLLLIALPGREGVVGVDLASRRAVSLAETAGPPFRLAVSGERR
jgi:YVTN family beta-propeller protein